MNSAGTVSVCGNWQHKRSNKSIPEASTEEIMASGSLLSENETLQSLLTLRSIVFKVKRLCILLFSDTKDPNSLFFSFVSSFVARNVLIESETLDPLGVFILLVLCSGSPPMDSISSPYTFMHVAVSLCLSAADYVRHKRKSDIVNSRDYIVSTMEKCLCASQFMNEALIKCTAQLLPLAIHSCTVMDVTTYVFDQCDNGIGERALSVRRAIMSCFSLGSTSLKWRDCFLPSSSIPVLKPSWYVDDGLLLPPFDALICCVDFLYSTLPFSLVQSFDRSPEVDSITQLLFPRGALNLSARVLLLTSSFATKLIEISSDPMINYVVTGARSKLRPVYQRLAERSIGTAGGGFISGEIDSQLAVGYLRLIPLKDALKVCYVNAKPRLTFYFFYTFKQFS
jgi:hypothetical protein